MREMRWTWMELQDTPLDVRQFVWDFIQLDRQAEAERAESRVRAAKAGDGKIRIPR